MEYNLIKQNGVSIAVIEDSGIVITDSASALDLIVSARFETGCEGVIISKSAIIDDFFVLSTGIAGDILQKFVNYRLKLAVVGDFSIYTSKPLQDFIYESNKGNNIFFVETEEEAARKLTVL